MIVNKIILVTKKLRIFAILLRFLKLLLLYYNYLNIHLSTKGYKTVRDKLTKPNPLNISVLYTYLKKYVSYETTFKIHQYMLF